MCHCAAGMQEHNPPHTCIRCVPVLLNGFGWIQPYTLPLGTYKTVMHGQYNNVPAHDRGQSSHQPNPPTSKRGNSIRPGGNSNATDVIQGMEPRPSLGIPNRLSRGSGVMHADMPRSDIQLDQWLAHLGIAHYSRVLRGLTVAQVMDMDAQKLRDAGVITSSAIRRIQHAKDRTRSVCK